MRIIVWLITFLWGIGQNLPFQQLYVHGINPGDFIFITLLAALLAVEKSQRILVAEAIRLKSLFFLIIGFVMLTAISMVVNAYTWGINGFDIIEMLRPLYYFLLVVFVSVYIQRYGVSIIVAFLAGILVTGIVAYFMPSNPDRMGFVVLWNPNVVGNMLAFGVLLTSVLIFERRIVVAAFFLIAFMVLSVFTFSKGTWLMVLLGFMASLIAMRASTGKHAKNFDRLIMIASVISLFSLIVFYFDALYELVTWKLVTTQIGDSASEGSTISARWGFVRASLLLAIENPMFGIGISNYESAYDSLQSWLGNDYWPTDNPHSAWLYVLACVGIPALVVFVGIVILTLNMFSRRVPLAAPSRHIYMGLVASVFFLSGAVVLHMLTQYFFWFFAGIASGWWVRRQDVQGGLV